MVGKSDDFGFFVWKKNGSRFEIKNNSVEDRKKKEWCTFRAPYLLMRVIFPSSLSGFTTTPKGNLKKYQRIIEINVRNPGLTIQKPNKLLIIHSRTDLDTNWIPNPPKIFYMCTRHLSRSVPDPKEVCSGIIKCSFFCSPRGSIFIDRSSCSIGRATRNRKFPC